MTYKQSQEKTPTSQTAITIIKNPGKGGNSAQSDPTQSKLLKA